jgi:hypothetical protein
MEVQYTVHSSNLNLNLEKTHIRHGIEFRPWKLSQRVEIEIVNHSPEGIYESPNGEDAKYQYEFSAIAVNTQAFRFYMIHCLQW